MQFKSVVVASAAVLVAVMGAYGCSSSPAKTDAGDGGKDGGRDVSTLPESGTCGSGLQCELCDMSGYTPTPMSKPVAAVNACLGTDITAFVTACLSSSSTTTTCNTWMGTQPDGGACMTCLLPVSSSAAQWGATYCTSQTSCFWNIAGCLDLTLNEVGQEKSSGGQGSCGDSISDWFGCDNYACTSCPNNDGPNGGSTGSSADKCYTSADANECASYQATANSATGPCTALGGDAAPPKSANCSKLSTDTDMANFLDIFCGAGPT